MAHAHPSQRYREVQVNTASKDDLLLLLVNGGVRFAEAGLAELKKDEEDVSLRSEKLVRAQKIVLELISSLSPVIGLDLYNNLQELYRFTFSRIFEGNVRGDAELVEEGVILFRQIRDMWVEAVEKAREERSTRPDRPVTNHSISLQG